MTLLLAEGFGWLGTGTHTYDATPYELTSGQWAQLSRDFIVTSYATGRQIVWANHATYGMLLVTNGLGDNAQINMGCRLVTSDAYTISKLICQFRDGGSILGNFGVKTDGKLYYVRGSRMGSGTEVAVSDTALSGPGENYVEIEVTFHGSTGTVKMWIDGIQVCDESGLDTINAGTLCDNCVIEGTSLYEGFRRTTGITDIYIDDSTQHGDVKVETVACSLAGTDSDWTPSAGNNEDNVDEIGPDEDTTYNESNTGTDKDGYKCAAMSDIGDIVALVHQVRVRKADAFDGKFKIGAIHNAVESQSADKSCATEYAEAVEIFETNPDTAAAWLAAQLGTAELTIENTTV